MPAVRSLSRRALLFGHSQVEPATLRPPWAQPETDFLQACTRCDACVRACPEQVLLRAADGFPRFDAQAGECTFCGDCVAACADGALTRAIEPPWTLRARVGEGCLSGQGVICASCRDACPESAIRIPLGARGPADIDGARCTGCSACVQVCPVDALSLQAAQTETNA